MTFDPEAYAPGQRMAGQFAKADTKAALWVNKVPWEVHSLPVMRRKNEQFIKPRDDGSMVNPNEWQVPIRVLAYRGDGEFGYQLQSDGEGGQETVEYILTFSSADWRDAQMNALAQYIQTAGRAGPFRLDKGQAQGNGAPPWVIKNWKPEDAGFPPVGAAAGAPAAVVVPATATVAPSAALSGSPPPRPQPPVAGPPPKPTPPPPPADPYVYDTRYDGVPIRWKDGMGDWEPVPDETPKQHVVHAQPLASTRTVVGINPGDRMEGAARTVVEQANGAEIRQTTYQGDGVVLTPQGVMTQVATGDEPRNRQEAITGERGPETPNLAQGAFGPTQTLPAAPAPSQAAQQGTVRQAYDTGSPISVTVACDHPDHTDKNGDPAEVTVPAFWDGAAGYWKQTHNCPGSKKVRIMDVTAAVKQAAGVA